MVVTFLWRSRRNFLLDFRLDSRTRGITISPRSFINGELVEKITNKDTLVPRELDFSSTRNSFQGYLKRLLCVDWTSFSQSLGTRSVEGMFARGEFHVVVIFSFFRKIATSTTRDWQTRAKIDNFRRVGRVCAIDLS